MIITLFETSGDIEVIREAGEDSSTSIEDMVNAIITSPDRPDEMEDAYEVEDITHGLFKSRVCAVTFTLDGRQRSFTVNDKELYRFNRGLPAFFKSCG